MWGTVVPPVEAKVPEPPLSPESVYAVPAEPVCPGVTLVVVLVP